MTDSSPQLISDGAIHGAEPRGGGPLTPVPLSSAADVSSAVERARAAQANWARLGREGRTALIKEAAKRLLRERSAGLAIVEREIGKAKADALFTEALGPLDALAGWTRVIDAAPAGKIGLNPMAFPKKHARILLVPRGVVAVIAPWNFPIAGLYRSVFPALLLGNSVVVKPSEHSPRSSAWFLQILADALPSGVVEVVQGAGEVGAELLRQPIDACVFTGSSRVGAQVEKLCQDKGIACSAEMGGNDAAIVLHDADLPRTVAGITQWALQNAGQACGAVEVVYADSRIAETLAARLADAFKRLEPKRDTTLAPLCFAEQRDRVMAQVEDAKAKGAVVLCGGTSDGLFVAPTVLSGCDADMSVVSEETFGPVVPIVSVDGPAEAIRAINAGKYGLTASIWTSDFERAEDLVEALDVGVVTVNNHAFTGAIVDLPWSGRRASGTGIANSAWSLLTFARPKAVVIDRSTGVEPFWLPYDDNLERLGHLLSDAQIGRVLGAIKIPGLLAGRGKAIKAFFGIR